jgi:hypothetical protein
MAISIDTSQLDELADDLVEVPEETRPKFRKVVERGALNVKNDLRAEAEGGQSYRHFPRSISYDMVGEFAAEIGPDKDRIQGALGNLLYFGSSKNAPVLPPIEGALDRETPRMMDAIGDVAEDIL